MTPEQFVYWLQGYMELTDAALPDQELGLTSDQVDMIKDHLGKVFNVSPNFGLNQPLNDITDLTIPLRYVSHVSC